jgi:hypothetical protein
LQHSAHPLRHGMVWPDSRICLRTFRQIVSPMLRASGTKSDNLAFSHWASMYMPCGSTASNEQKVAFCVPLGGLDANVNVFFMAPDKYRV